MSLCNWDEADKAHTGNNYKSYAENGNYEVKLAKVSVVDQENWKAPAIQFEWEEDDERKYPKSPRHFLSLTNTNYTGYHTRALLIQLGVSKETAQGWLDKLDISDRAKFVKSLQAIFDRVAEKHPTVKVVVRPQMRDGKPILSANGFPYGETEFADSSCMLRQVTETKPAETEAVAEEDVDLFGDDTEPF